MSTTPLRTSVTLAFIISSFLWRWRPRCRQFCLIDNGNGMNYNFMSLIQFKRCPVRSAAARARPLSSNQIPAQTKYYFNGSPTAGGQQQPSFNKVSAVLQWRHETPASPCCRNYYKSNLGIGPSYKFVQHIQHPSEDMAIYLESVVFLAKTNQRQ